MTETEWRECISPDELLAHLGERADRRKRCLLACACVRRIGSLLTDEQLRQAVEWFERGADKPRAAKKVQQARRVVRALRKQLEAEERRQGSWPARAARAAAQAVEVLLAKDGPILERPRDNRDLPDVVTCTRTARTAARAAEAWREEHAGRDVPLTSMRLRPLAALDAADLVREIFGNPFRPATVDPSWLAWNDGAVPRIARAIYDARHFHELPMLADLLEGAGCVDPDMLEHCRAPMEHVRGCWVVDAVLGMK